MAGDSRSRRTKQSSRFYQFLLSILARPSFVLRGILQERFIISLESPRLRIEPHFMVNSFSCVSTMAIRCVNKCRITEYIFFELVSRWENFNNTFSEDYKESSKGWPWKILKRRINWIGIILDCKRWRNTLKVNFPSFHLHLRWNLSITRRISA